MEYNSTEEAWFAEWLDEGICVGLVDSYLYEPNSFELIEKQTACGKNVFQSMAYTPDFEVLFTERGEIAFAKRWVDKTNKFQDCSGVWVDV